MLGFLLCVGNFALATGFYTNYWSLIPDFTTLNYSPPSTSTPFESRFARDLADSESASILSYSLALVRSKLLVTMNESTIVLNKVQPDSTSAHPFHLGNVSRVDFPPLAWTGKGCASSNAMGEDILKKIFEVNSMQLFQTLIWETKTIIKLQ